MKILISLILLSIGIGPVQLAVQAQMNNNQVTVTMTPYDYQGSRLQMSEMNLPNGWDCRIQTCPEKFADQSENIFMLGSKGQNAIKIKVAKKIMKRLKRKNNMIGIVDGDRMLIYNYNKGMVKSIRILTGDT